MSRIDSREAVVFFVYQYEFRIEDLEQQINLYIENNGDLEEDID